MDTLIKIAMPGGRLVNASIGARIIATDQPASNGGTDSAPTPFELFLAAIGTCAGHSAAAYCESRGIPTGNLSLEMVCHRSSEERRYDRMSLRLLVPEDFPQRDRIAIERAMNHCSVKKHILQAPEFELAVESA